MASKNINTDPTTSKALPGKALQDYRKAAEKLARAAHAHVRSPQQQKNGVVDAIMRKSETAALVEYLVALKVIELDQYLARCAEVMDQQTAQIEKANLSILVPANG